MFYLISIINDNLRLLFIQVCPLNIDNDINIIIIKILK